MLYPFFLLLSFIQSLIRFCLQTIKGYSFSICRPLLKQIKNSAESHIVLDCSTDRIYDVLKQAQQIGMMSDYHSYLITSLVSVCLQAFRKAVYWCKLLRRFFIGIGSMPVDQKAMDS